MGKNSANDQTHRSAESEGGQKIKANHLTIAKWLIGTIVAAAYILPSVAEYWSAWWMQVLVWAFGAACSYGVYGFLHGIVKWKPFNAFIPAFVVFASFASVLLVAYAGGSMPPFLSSSKTRYFFPAVLSAIALFAWIRALHYSAPHKDPDQGKSSTMPTTPATTNSMTTPSETTDEVNHNPFVVRAGVCVVNFDMNKIIQICYAYGGPDQAHPRFISPIVWSYFIDFTNTSNSDFMISSYSFDARLADGSWKEMISIPVQEGQGQLYSVIDVHHAAKVDLKVWDFNRIIMYRNIRPGETIQGWVFFNPPKDISKIYGTRIRVFDPADRLYTQEIQSPKPGLPVSPQMAPIFFQREALNDDISNLELRAYGE
jgi:hypothetical protein